MFTTIKDAGKQSVTRLEAAETLTLHQDGGPRKRRCPIINSMKRCPESGFTGRISLSLFTLLLLIAGQTTHGHNLVGASTLIGNRATHNGDSMLVVLEPSLRIVTKNAKSVIDIDAVGNLPTTVAASTTPPGGRLTRLEDSSALGRYPSRSQRMVRSVITGPLSDMTMAGTHESLASSSHMVAHEPPAPDAMSQDLSLPLTAASSVSAAQQGVQTEKQQQQPQSQDQQNIGAGGEASLKPDQIRPQQSDQLSADTFWPAAPNGEPFGFAPGHSPATGFGQRSSVANKAAPLAQATRGTGEQAAPSTRLDRSQEARPAPAKRQQVASEHHNGEKSRHGSPPPDPIKMATEDEYAVKSNEDDFDEHVSHDDDDDDAHKKGLQKHDASTSKNHHEETNESYEAHAAPKKIIIKKEEKHHHHYHHHHHHEPVKKVDHKKRVQSPPLHLEIHIKGKSKSKIKVKAESKGDKRKTKSKDGDEIYVKLNQDDGHYLDHHDGGGNNQRAGSDGYDNDDGSYVDSNEANPGPVEDKKSLIEDEPTSGSEGVANGERANSLASAMSGADSRESRKTNNEQYDKEQASGESKSTKNVDHGSHYDSIDTAGVPKYFEVFGEEAHDEKSSEIKEKHDCDHKQAHEGSDEIAEHPDKVVEQHEDNNSDIKETNSEGQQQMGHKGGNSKKGKKKEKKEKKGKKKELVKVEEPKKPVEQDKEEKKEEHEEKREEYEEKKEEHEEKKEEQQEEKKEEHEEKKKEHEEKKEEPQIEAEPKQEDKKQQPAEPKKKKEDKGHKTKHAHIEVHKHNHYEHHEHINLEQKPEVEHHHPELHNQEHHPEIEQHQEEKEPGIQHMDVEGMHQEHGGYEAPMMHHHDPEHHHPIKEHWDAPNLYEKPHNEHHPHGAFVIEDHSLLDKHDMERPAGHWKEEIINHPHGLGLTPVAAYNLMGAFSSRSTSHSETAKPAEHPTTATTATTTATKKNVKS
jgi:hypothetical protein